MRDRDKGHGRDMACIYPALKNGVVQSPCRVHRKNCRGKARIRLCAKQHPIQRCSGGMFSPSASTFFVLSHHGPQSWRYRQDWQVDRQYTPEGETLLVSLAMRFMEPRISQGGSDLHWLRSFQDCHRGSPTLTSPQATVKEELSQQWTHDALTSCSVVARDHPGRPWNHGATPWSYP